MSNHITLVLYAIYSVMSFIVWFEDVRPIFKHGSLGASICMWLLAGVQLTQSDYQAAGFDMVASGIWLWIWYRRGGNDDFRKRRKRLAAKVRNKLRAMAPVFVPAPVRS